MSLTNILVPNQYNIFVGSLNSQNPIELTTNGCIIRHWSIQTTNATPTLSFSYPISNIGAYTLETTCQGLSTANDASSIQRGDLVSFSGGSLTYRGNSYQHFFNSAGIATASMNQTVVGNNINVTVTGVVGKTINWTGITYIYF